MIGGASSSVLGDSNFCRSLLHHGPKRHRLSDVLMTKSHSKDSKYNLGHSETQEYESH